MNKNPKKKGRLIRRLALPILLAVVLTYPVLKQLHIEQLKEVFVSFNWLFFAGSLACLFLRSYARALRLRVLSGSQESTGSFFAMISLQSFFLLMLPVALGELALVYLMNKINRVAGSKGMASVTVARVLDLGLYLLLAMAFLSFAATGLPSALKWGGLGLTAAFVVACLLGWALLRGRGQISASPQGPGLVARLKGYLLSYLEALRQVVQQGRGLILFLCSLSILVLNLAVMTCNIKAFDSSIPMLKIILFNIIATPLYMLPVKGIGNFGTHEAVYFFGLQLFGVSEGRSSALSLATHSLDFVLVGISATVGIGMLLVMKKRRRRQASLQNEQQPVGWGGKV